MKKFVIGLGAAALMSTSAMAADLGGNCCADLEERLAELEATAARKGNRKVSLVVSGQVSRGVLWIDDRTFFVDNPNSQTRFRFVGKAKINPKATAGYIIEIGLNEDADDQLKIRHSAVWLESDLGRVTIGQYSMAGDGAAEMDLSATAVASTLLSLQPLAGVSPFDAPRAQVARYDSPILAGFRASAAWVGDGSEAWDVALRYAGEIGKLQFAAAISYRDEGDAKATFGSASARHLPTGLFLSGAAGRYEVGDLEIDAWHIKGGVEQKVSTLGKTSLFAEYADAEFDGNGLGTFIGAGVVQQIDAAAMDVFLAARFYDLDEGDSFETVFAGARIKF